MKYDPNYHLDPNLRGTTLAAQEYERKTGQAPQGFRKQRIRQPNQNNSVMTGNETVGRTFVHEPNRNLHGLDGELHPDVIREQKEDLPKKDQNAIE